LKSDPMPDWVADEVEAIVMAKKFTVDNVEYLTEDTEQIFKNPEIIGSNYQNIDLPLSQCKCELVYSC